jgi:hypothetical protein
MAALSPTAASRSKRFGRRDVGGSWPTLPEPIRRAMLALIGYSMNMSVKGNAARRSPINFD